jgi:diguanylate cyclase (GGDEF)-like protein/PAS domain S-box-containing protein
VNNDRTSHRHGAVRTGRGAWPRVLLFGLAIIAMAVAAASVLSAISAYAGERQDWARDLVKVETLVNEQRAQAWKIEAGYPPPFPTPAGTTSCSLAFCDASIPDTLQRPLREMAGLLDTATAHDAGNPRVVALRRDVGVYDASLRDEFRLLAADLHGRNSSLLIGTLDPAASTLAADLEGLQASYSSLADQAVRTAKISIYIVLILVALGLTALLSYVGRARRANAVLDAVRRSEESFRLLFASNPHPVFVCDQDSLAVFQVNEAAMRVYGYSRDEFLGMRFTDIQSAEDTPGRIDGASGQSRHRVRSGRVIDVEIAVQRLIVGGRPSVVMLTQDITGRKALADHIQHQAWHDPLTSLPNRALFCERVEHARARSRRSGLPFAILILDLDNFKTVNDTFGHAAGDEVLLSAAAHLCEHLRPGDTAARLGGDEFAILLEDVETADDAMLVATRIAGVLRGTMHLTSGHEVTVGASAGIALSDQGSNDVGELLRKADVAMYWAKQQGRGKAALFDHPMGAHLVERMQTELALRRGIEAGELEIHYQPVVEVSGARIVGAEALVRWRHPQRGLLPPAAFIELAEQTGLIGPLELWVLEEACRQAVRWHRSMPTDPPLPISVNISGRHLVVPGFVEEVAVILASTEIDPHSLLLEVTESAAVEGDGAGMRALWRLRELGVRLSIDDFGTGFSSLSYLKRFPGATVLKIDKSFIDGLATNKADAAIAHAIVAMATTVGLRTVAEGVETAEQLEELRKLGCDYAQGYLFARPMPAAQLTEMLTQGGVSLDPRYHTIAPAHDDGSRLALISP